MLCCCTHSALYRTLNTITSPRDALFSMHHAVTPPIDTSECCSGVLQAFFMAIASVTCLQERRRCFPDVLNGEINIWNYFQLTQETWLRISQSAFQQWLMKLYSLFSAWEYAGVCVLARLCWTFKVFEFWQRDQRKCALLCSRVHACACVGACARERESEKAWKWDSELKRLMSKNSVCSLSANCQPSITIPTHGLCKKKKKKSRARALMPACARLCVSGLITHRLGYCE